jgi:drug/metabolite transporter (DMT)-like permease
MRLRMRLASMVGNRHGPAEDPYTSRFPLDRSSPAFRIGVAFAALYILWGSTYLAMKVAVAEVPPFLMAGSRFLVAGSILAAWCAARGQLGRKDLNRTTWTAAATVAVGLMLFGNGGVAIAVDRIPTGIVATLVAVTPLWMTLMDWFSRRKEAQRRPPSIPTFVGLGLGVAGVAFLNGIGSSDAADRLDPVGLGVLLLATLGWSSASIYSRTAPRAGSPVAACAMQMLAGGAILLATSMVFEDWPERGVLDLSWKFWAGWSFLVVFGSLCGFTAYIWLLQHVPAAKVATYAYVNPVIALFLGSTVAGEPFTQRQLIACGLILGGTAVIVTAGTRAAKGETVAVPSEDGVVDVEET